ncbi:dopamine receptor 1-like [Teleopsis dalmanni]|uniref:dopamine receptor 1-like n=1 Tax=Teleopsis dalmanni TaxID=139649 RepID=UPI0018CE4D52|nr:dopamine receptor 1-like [Teleopsis dalmanni]
MLKLSCRSSKPLQMFSGPLLWTLNKKHIIFWLEILYVKKYTKCLSIFLLSCIRCLKKTTTNLTELWSYTIQHIEYRLYCYAQKHVKSIKAVTRPGEVAEKQRYKSIRRPKNQQKKFKVRNLHHSSPYHVSDHKAAITVGVIMGVFLICWVPFFCVNIVAAFCKTCIGGQTFKILSWLGYSNSAFNPIIYSIFNKEFRDAFKRILTTRNPWCCTQDVGNIHPRNSDRFVTDYAAKNVVVMNSGRSSAELEQVSAI